MKNVKSVVLYDNYILFEDGRWFSIKNLKFLKPNNNGSLYELGLSIDHKDKNKHHNYKSNLELVTHQENCRRKFSSVEDYALPF